MPAEMTTDPLGLDCLFTNGQRSRIAVPAGFRNETLATNLVTALIELIHPRGGVDAAGTVRHHMRSLSGMVSWFDDRGFTGGVKDLTRSQVAEFLMSRKTAVERNCRQLLIAFGNEVEPLSPGVMEFVTGKTFHPKRRRNETPLAPYSEAEWGRLQHECLEVINDSYAENRRAVAAANRGQRPSLDTWTYEDVCWLLADLGPTITNASVSRLYGVCAATIASRSGGVVPARRALFPQTSTVIAYMLLFGSYTGIVPDGIANLGIKDLDWTGDSEILLSYFKGRTAAESLVLNKDAVKLLEQWLRHSASLRQFAPADKRGALWIRYQQGQFGHQFLTGATDYASLRKWVKNRGLVDDNGSPLKLHRHRIRTTFESTRDRRTWFGSARATIDPNHTPAVEGDHYLSVTTPGQQRAIEGVIEEAQGDLVRQACVPQVLLGEADAAEIAERFPQLVNTLNLDGPALAELVGGERDVFVAGCADQLAGVHGPVGKPCPARPWVCLLCPLALFTPRHATNLLRLKAYFARQWLLMAAPQYMAVFGPYSARLDEVLALFPPDVLTRSATHISDTDQDIPLRPEEGTQ